MKWNGPQRNSSRRTETQMRIAFKDCFEDLFDIVHAEALSVITTDEDGQFLIAQREEWRGSMTSVDKVWEKKEKLKEERVERARKLKVMTHHIKWPVSHIEKMEHRATFTTYQGQTDEYTWYIQ